MILPYVQNWTFSSNFQIEASLSWFQLSTNRLFKNLLISIVKNKTQQPETASERLPELQSWAFSLNFWVELLFITIINITIIGNP